MVARSSARRATYTDLEVLARDVFHGDAPVRAVAFDAVALTLAELWERVSP